MLFIRKYNQTLLFNHVFTNTINTFAAPTGKVSNEGFKERKYCNTEVIFLKPFLSISILNSSSKLSGIPDAGLLSGIPDAEGGGGDILITQLVKSRSKSDMGLSDIKYKSW